MDDKLQRAIRESERAGHRLVPRPPDELLQALKDATSTGAFPHELVALRDWLSQFCEDVQPADNETRRLEEIAKMLDNLRQLQPPFVLQRPPWPQNPPIYPGPIFRSPYGVIPLGLPGPRYTGMPIVGFPVQPLETPGVTYQPEITYHQPQVTYHPAQTIMTVNTPGLSMGTSTSGSASIANVAA